AAARNRWGDTSTPIVSRVILEISVPRFFVVSRPPVVEEIQRALVAGLDLSRSGRDWLRYSSTKRLSNAGTRRSSGRRDFVRWAGKAIHQLPWTSLKVRPISKPAKFFSRIGQSASRATMRAVTHASGAGEIGRSEFLCFRHQCQASFQQPLRER